MVKNEGNQTMSRLKEPSTYAGLAAIVAGLGQVFHFAPADTVAGAITSVAPQVISGNWFGAVTALLGIGAVFIREKGGK